jgi:hypothetical protein
MKLQSFVLSAIVSLICVGCFMQRNPPSNPEKYLKSSMPTKSKAGVITIDSLNVVSVVNTNGQLAKRFTFTVSGCDLNSTNVMQARNKIGVYESWIPIIVFVQQTEPYTFTRTINLTMVMTNTFFRVYGNPDSKAVIADDVDPTCTLYLPVVYTNQPATTTNHPGPPPMPTALRKAKR